MRLRRTEWRNGFGLSLVLLVVVTLTPPLVFGADGLLNAQIIPSPETDWPQFRGPRRDGISTETGLLSAWPESGPKHLWTATNLGHGYSSPVICNGKLFITGDAADDLCLFALDFQGRQLWKSTNGASWKDPYPGARASVTYSDRRVYLQNAHGRLACYEAKSGREVWQINVLQRFGGKELTWGLAECVLVDDERVYSTIGGSEALVVALDKATGALIWKSDPLLNEDGKTAESTSYASPLLVRFGGRRLLLTCSLRHIVSLDADTGKRQWVIPMPTTHSVLALMPVLVGNSVFITAPHGEGGRLLDLVLPPGPNALVQAKERWRTPLDSLQGCVVQMDGLLFGSYYSKGKGLAAVEAKSGRVLYDNMSFAKGALLGAEGLLYYLAEDGWMRLLRPSGSEFEIRGQFRLPGASGRDAWAHPVIHAGRLYLRYHTTLYCFGIKRQ